MSGWQSGPTQPDEQPVKPVELGAVTEKDNGRMNGDNFLQAFDAYAVMFRGETKPHRKWT